MKLRLILLSKVFLVFLLPFVPALPELIRDFPRWSLNTPRLSNPLCGRSSVGMPAHSPVRRASPFFSRKEIRKRTSDWTLDRLEVPRWKLYRTDYFVIRSDVLLEDLRTVGVYLEEFRKILVREIGGDSSEIRFSVHLFRYETPFHRYSESRGMKQRGLFYDQERSEVVALLPEKGEWISFFGHLMHELTHLYLGRVFEDTVSPWLNEGLAEYFGAMKIDRSGIHVGREIPSYRVLLAAFSNTADWIPLARISRMNGSDYFLKAPPLVHAESWSFVRYIFRSNKRALPALISGNRVGGLEKEWMKSLRGRVP